MPFMNDEELNNVLLKEFQEIMDYVSQNILDKIIESMDDVVYDAGTPAKYKRNRMNGGLLGSFKRDDAKIKGQTIESLVEHDPNSMKFNPMEYTHGSFYYDPTDIREFLITIIREGKSGPLFGSGYWMENRDFWNPVIENIKNGSYDYIIEQEMDSRGIIWKKI
jgi:hypothetical protein